MAHDKYFISGKRSVTVAIFLPSNLNIAQIGNSRELFSVFQMDAPSLA
jgi:hypothetical protein